MEMRWKCSRCDEWHTGLPDVAFHAPVYYDMASPDERERDFQLTSDTCVMIENGVRHFFVRTVMFMPILDTLESFSWGVWISLSQSNFEKYVSLKDPTVIAAEPLYVGWLSNRINHYPDTLNLKARIKLQSNGHRPHLELEPTNHPLAVEQHKGISLARAQEIATWALHSRPSEP